VAAQTNLVRDYADEIIRDDDSPGKRFKAVTHGKTSLKKEMFPGNSWSSGTTVRTDISNVSGSFWPTWFPPNMKFHGWENIGVSWSKDDDTLMREAMDKFFNVNEVDSLLNVIESPELVTSAQSMYNAVFPAVQRRVSDTRLTMKQARQYFSRFSSFIAGGYLYYSFGIAPLISDMRKLSRNTDAYKRRLRNVLKNAGREITIHHSCSGSVSSSLVNVAAYPLASWGNSPDVGKTWTATVYATATPRKVCTIKGIRDQRYNTESFQTLDFLASRFGSSGPASFLWERIPFSFVVDWFLDLSGVLNSLDNALTGNNKRITDSCIGYKWSALSAVAKLRDSVSTPSTEDGRQIALVETSLYHRYPVSPTTTVGLSGRFGKKQVSITAALIGQMAANLATKR